MSYPFRPIGPEGPEPYRRLERLTLEKAKVAAIQQIGPQVAHSMKAKTLADTISGNLIFSLQTEVMSHKDGTDSQEVWSEVEVPLWHKKWVPVFCVVLLGVSIAWQLLGLFWPPVIGLGVASFTLLHYLLFTPQSVKVRKPFIVKAEKWTRFPENDKVFPKSLGASVIQIVTEVEEE